MYCLESLFPDPVREQPAILPAPGRFFVGFKNIKVSHVLLCVWLLPSHTRAVPSQKQKQSPLSGMFCRISFIPNHFNRNTSRNRLVPVTFEFVTICDICDQNVTKSVLLTKLSHFLTVTNVTHCV